MWLVSYYEHNISWNAVWTLVALLLKSDPSAWFPAPFYSNGQNFLLKTGRMTVIVHYSARYFHFLDTAMENLFQRKH
ncbi:hypothetical protein BpHYR1_028648 [Brachionus plicatilis]|uniref:Uncharacterized protein n=1 Tax=Brachionus plicatilis TaxID=10195 RepID=A0A3M7RCU6_BRAPC|nr:hypothetical protein BpHYR1_028648 [Brachionus plicatilis]